MCVNVSIQVALLFVAIRTVTAFVGFFTGMLASMQNQIRRAAKFLVTIGTLCSFPGVQSHVRFQSCVLCKRFWAIVTCVWSLAGVCSQMAFESIALRELGAALVAMKGTFAGVGSLVTPQS